MPIVMPLSYMAFLFILSSIPDTGAATHLAERLVAMIPPTVQDLLHIPAYGLLILENVHADANRYQPCQRRR